jgi:trans-aconitate methyltransferase
MSTTTPYTFGDNDRAADRLDLLARAFEASSREFLRRVGEMGEAWCAADLGAGLAHTTELLATCTAPVRTVGFELSPRLLARARHRASWLELFQHDVTRAPFPVEGVELAYARFLLTHLASPAAALATWAGALAPAARIALEETADMRSDDATFARYYEHVAALQEHHRQDMKIGKRLGALATEAGYRVEHAELAPVVLDARVMARLHAMNVRTWREDAFARTAFDGRVLDAITEDLDAVAEGARAAPPVTCVMGRLLAKAPG